MRVPTAVHVRVHVLAEQAGHVLAGRCEGVVERGRDHQFDDRRARPARVVLLRFRIEVGLLEVAQRRPDQDAALVVRLQRAAGRSEEHTSELQSLMRISYAVFCLHKKQTKIHYRYYTMWYD